MLLLFVSFLHGKLLEYLLGLGSIGGAGNNSYGDPMPARKDMTLRRVEVISHGQSSKANPDGDSIDLFVSPIGRN